MNATHTDWDLIERDYRAGLLSLREIGAANGVTEGAIRKRARRDGWQRDLTAKIQARAEDLVRKSEVRTLARSNEVAYEREIIQANAERIAQVRSAHRQDIERLRLMARRLIVQFEAAVEDNSLREQATILRILVDTVKTIVGLEREAYSIDKATPEQPQDDKPPTDMMDVVRRFAFILAGHQAVQ